MYTAFLVASSIFSETTVSYRQYDLNMMLISDNENYLRIILLRKVFCSGDIVIMGLKCVVTKKHLRLKCAMCNWNNVIL